MSSEFSFPIPFATSSQGEVKRESKVPQQNEVGPSPSLEPAPGYANWAGRVLFSASLSTLVGVSGTLAGVLGAMSLAMPWVATAIAVSGLALTVFLGVLIFQEVTAVYEDLGLLDGDVVLLDGQGFEFDDFVNSDGASCSYSSVRKDDDEDESVCATASKEVDVVNQAVNKPISDPFGREWSEERRYILERLAERVCCSTLEELSQPSSKDEGFGVSWGVHCFQRQVALLQEKASLEEDELCKQPVVASKTLKIEDEAKAAKEYEQARHLMELREELEQDLEEEYRTLDELIDENGPAASFSALRELLRELPVPVIPESAHGALKELGRQPSRKAIRKFWRSLDKQRRECFYWVIRHLAEPLGAGTHGTTERQQRFARFMAPSLTRFNIAESSEIIDGLAVLFQYSTLIGKTPAE